MTDTLPDTETVEGILTLLRGRIARGESPHQGGDSFPFAAFLEAMNTVHDESLDQDALALCVTKLKGVLTLQPEASLAAFTKPYIDAAFRVVNREQRALEESAAPATPA